MTEQQAPVRRKPRSRARKPKPRGRKLTLGVWWKAVIGIVGPTATIIGTLLALGVIHPFGGGDSALAAAAGQTQEAGTASAIISVDFVAGGKSITQSLGRAKFDFVSQTYSADLETRTATASSRSELVYVAGSLFQRVTPESLQPLPGGRHWLSIDLGKVAGTNTSSELGLLGLGESDPSHFLAYLKSSGNVKKIGPDTLFTVPTTHYAADLDPDKPLANFPAQRKAAAVSGERVHEDAWIDARGLVRRIKLVLVIPPLTFDETVDFTSFGDPVTITAPPVEDTANVGELLAGRLPPTVSIPVSLKIVTPRKWAALADAVCARTLNAERRLKKPANPLLVEGWLRRQIPIAVNGVLGLARIGRPQGREQQAVQYVEGLAREADMVRVELLAFLYGTIGDLQRLNRTFTPLDDRSNRMAIALGARVCAES
ncbi:MAG TPA: hypothetical protein VLJ76_04285 [Gaiellaceae bacterium]|nr:hypothetical protein [Gaiellaceae bacterium]